MAISKHQFNTKSLFKTDSLFGICNFVLKGLENINKLLARLLVGQRQSIMLIHIL